VARLSTFPSGRTNYRGHKNERGTTTGWIRCEREREREQEREREREQEREQERERERELEQELEQEQEQERERELELEQEQLTIHGRPAAELRGMTCGPVGMEPAGLEFLEATWTRTTLSARARTPSCGARLRHPSPIVVSRCQTWTTTLGSGIRRRSRRAWPRGAWC
jgi:hypothetical protein